MHGGKNMKKINEKKWNEMKGFDSLVKEEYGAPGTPEREAFEARAKSYYFAEQSQVGI